MPDNTNAAENRKQFSIYLPIEVYEKLVELAEEDDSGEVVILKVEPTENPEEESYVSVSDDDVLMTVFEIFKEKFKDEFNFED